MKGYAKRNSIVVVLILLSFLFSSQALALVSGQQLWKKHYGGDYLNGRPAAMVKDNSDNLYVAGTVGNGVIIIKYDPAGNQRWARKYPGLQLNDRNPIVVDKDRSVYVAGSRYNGSDGEEIALLKYSTVGNLMWVRKFGSHSRYSWGSQANGVVIDNKDNIYVAGSNRENFILIKYDKLGNRLWARQYDDKKGTYSFANKLVIDKDNNVLISGVNISFSRYYQDEKINFSIIKYSSTGTRKWIVNFKKFNFYYYFGEDTPQLAADPYGNIIVATSEKGPDGSSDYKITKFNSNGKQKWIRWYDAGGDSLSALAVDGVGNIYATGQTVNRVGKIIEQDFSTVKYDKKGNRRWARKFDGSGANDNSVINDMSYGYYPSYDAYYSYGQLKDRAVGIVIGNNNSVYVTGTIDAGKKRNSDIAIVKYDSHGKQRWARTYNSSYQASDSPTTIIKDVAGNIYVAGSSNRSKRNRYYFGYPFYYSDGISGRFTILKYTP